MNEMKWNFRVIPKSILHHTHEMGIRIENAARDSINKQEEVTLN